MSDEAQLISAMIATDKARLRIVRDEAAFAALEPYWDAILEKSAVRTPFMTWDWANLWFQQHKHECKLCIGVVDDERSREPIAIAPLVLGRARDGSRRMLRHITFIGCLGKDGSQGMDFILPAGRESVLMPLLAKTFARSNLSWDVIDLPSVHEESPNLPFFKAVLSRYSAPGERFAAQNSYVMTLPSSWDEQLSRWRSKERVSFRSKWSKLMDERQGRALLAGVDMPFADAFEELWRVHQMRFGTEKSLFVNNASHAFHRELVKRWAPQGRIMLPLIEAEGRIIAARYGFVRDGKFWSFQTGYDPAWSQSCAGKLSLGWSVQCAIKRGLRELDHLPGEARYKEEWSTHSRRVVHLEAFNPLSLTALAFRGVRALNRQRLCVTESQNTAIISI